MLMPQYLGTITSRSQANLPKMLMYNNTNSERLPTDYTNRPNKD
jgi:hypothetical protein